MFYWKSANLIGSPIVFNALIEQDRARISDNVKVHKIVGLEQESCRVFGNTVRLHVLVLYER